MTWWQQALLVLSTGIVASGGTVLAARVAARSSEKAAAISADTEREGNAVEGYHQLVTDLQGDVARLRSDVSDLRGRTGDLEHEVSALRDERREHRALIRRMWGRLQAALTEIKRLGGTPPPDVYHDAERVRLILESDSS